MKMSSPSTSLQLLPCDDQARITPVSGMIITGTAIAGLARKLARRAAHYPALQATAVKGELVLWSMAEKPELPWMEEPCTYLVNMQKMVFLPAGQRLNIPVRQIEPVFMKLMQDCQLGLPVLVNRYDGETRLTGLGRNSAPVRAINWDSLARNGL